MIIEDRYDYAQGAMGGSLAGIMANEMYYAQQAGVIVPFYTYIVEGTNNNPCNQSCTPNLQTYDAKRMYVDRAIIGASEYKEYTIVFDTTGNKVFQTFGNLDTIMEIRDAQGNLIKSNDDGGYGTNSYIRHFCTAGTTYRIRVYLYSYSFFGEFLFTATPADGIAGPNSSHIFSFDDILAINVTTSYTLNTYLIRDQTRFCVFVPSQTAEYTIDAFSECDSYLYVIEPDSFVEWKNGRDYNDDGGTGMNPLITRQLKAGVPYLIVFSAFNINSPSSVGDIGVSITMN